MKSYAVLLEVPRWIAHLLRRFYRQLLVLLFTFSSTSSPSSPIRIADHTAASQIKEHIFIASLHWNGEKLIREHWEPAILNLAWHFGKDNVYISVVDGGSGDDAKGALRELGLELEKMGVVIISSWIIDTCGNCESDPSRGRTGLH